MLLHQPSYGYQGTYQVMAHEIDPEKKITAHALLQLMQEASLQNAILLRVSLWDLEDKQLSWVLLRKRLDVVRWPELGEVIRIVTYPAGFDKIFAYRDFIAYDEDDNLVASASSTWTLMNLRTRRAVRIPPFMMELVPEVPEDVLPRVASKLPKTAERDESYTTSIRYFDLDWNGHVNNLTLVKLMLQGLPKESWKARSIQSMSYHIKSECLLGDLVTIETTEEEFDNHIVIEHQDKGTIAALHVSWPKV